jgi:[calcium/calmodulin-dependent protein kinase] kinase
VSEKFETSDIMAKTAGTYHFFPPECCDPDIEEYSGKQADIWALGVTLYCMIFNQLPFWDHDNCENEYTILEFILKNEVEIPEGSRTDISNDLIELLYQML